jgi:hypothetical protein
VLRGSEAGILSIWDDADLLVYAGVGSLSDGAMETGVYCCSGRRLLSARIGRDEVGRDEEGASSTSNNPDTTACLPCVSEAALGVGGR